MPTWRHASKEGSKYWSMHNAPLKNIGFYAEKNPRYVKCGTKRELKWQDAWQHPGTLIGLASWSRSINGPKFHMIVKRRMRGEGGGHDIFCDLSNHNISCTPNAPVHRVFIKWLSSSL